MASSSQSLDFSFSDALRDFGSRLFRDRPNEARKLARNRGGDHGLQFPAWASLRYRRQSRSWALPGYVSDWLASTFLGAEGDRDRYVLETGSSMPPRSNMRCAAPLPALVIPLLASRASAGMLGRNETQIGHELPRIGETGDVAEFRHQRRRGHQREATQRLQRLHHWRAQRPVLKRGFDVGFKMIPPSRRRLDGRDV